MAILVVPAELEGTMIGGMVITAFVAAGGVIVCVMPWIVDVITGPCMAGSVMSGNTSVQGKLDKFV